MAFCKYSTEFIANSKTEIDNIFLNDYLPFAEPQFVVVYIYGLYLCNSNSFDNSLENFAKTLNMSEEDVIGAFEFWEEQGLVRVLKTNPIEVSFIPLKNVLTANKLYNPDKYATFNSQANDIFMGKRSISKHEYEEYYDFLERYHVEQEALIMIMRYCVESKKSAVGYHYILTVASNWANEGITSVPQVEEKISNLENKSPEVVEIFTACGIKRNPYIEEKALINKWLNDYGFSLDVILYACKKAKKKSRCSLETIDEILTRYYGSKLFSVLEIEDFEKQKKDLFTLAKEINKTIGVYYENLEGIVENYILKWLNMGFDKDLLLEIAFYCFKTSVRTLEGMDKTITKLFKLGILSLESFHQYMGEILSTDNRIKEILSKLQVNRNVSYIDRENYRTWKENWNMNDELIDYGASLAAGKDNPIKYLSRVLSDWQSKGIKTVDEAKNTSPIVANNEPKKKDKNFTGRSYSSSELNALFQSINEVDV